MGTIIMRRCQFENSDDIGTFSRLTNSFCIIPPGSSKKFYSAFESEIKNTIPLLKTSIAATKIVGRLCVGNKNGLLLPGNISGQELQHISNCLNEDTEIQLIQDRHSAFGNTITCNDYVALIHPDIGRDTEEIIASVLGVEVFRQTVGGQTLVGSYSCLSNQGGLVTPNTTDEDLHALSSLLQIPMTVGTVNGGSDVTAAGIVVNDWTALCGL